MRIYSKVLTIGAVLVAVGVTVPNASAQSTCAIGYTGPGSSNICTSIQTYACEVTNNNQVTVNGQNAQGSVSGNATGAGSQTGTATNSNGAVFNFEISNTGVCTAVRTMAPIKETPQPITPSTSKPVVSTAPVSAPVATKPTVLAETGDGVLPWVPFVGIATALGGVLAARWATLTYLRRN